MTITDNPAVPGTGRDSDVVRPSPPDRPPAAEERPVDFEPMSGRRVGGGYVFRVALTVLSVVLLSFTLNVVVISRLEHRASQHRAFERFRAGVANGTAPLGQTDWQGGQTTGNGRLLALGTPVALLAIPSIHVNEVVEEGTTGGVLMSGPGHRRDTPLPGQGGTASYILGREAAYGGPFGRIHDLHKGDRIVTTTQEGQSTFKVLEVRQAGDPEPPALKPGEGRLTLETATGGDFMPSGILFVDADLVTATLPSAPPGLALGAIPADERAMASDTNTLWALVLWLEAILVLAVAAVWSWHRWGRAQTWVVFVPSLGVVGYFCSQQVALLLPNLT